MKMLASLAMFAVVSGLVLAAAPSFAADELKVGDAAPDFSLVGSDGKTYKLADFKGKQAVVVAWFPKAFTGGCTLECKSFAQDGAKIRAYNVAYFTASTDQPDLNKKFAESAEIKADYPILSDPTAKTAQAYGIYNADRKVANRVTFYIGKDGKIAAIDRMVKPASAATDVAAKLKELKVEEKK
jgi:peroxiredoxin Q/BCP